MNLIERLEDALDTIKVDANMALNEEWDRSDDGFTAQIELVDKVIDRVEATGVHKLLEQVRVECPFIPRTDVIERALRFMLANGDAMEELIVGDGA